MLVLISLEHIALNAWKAGDYFIYIDRRKSAFFQVSEEFGEDIKDALAAEGIRSNAVIQRQQEVVQPTQVIQVARERNMLPGIASRVGIGASLFSVAASVAGLAACNVM